jgi:hypothetical protein
MSLEARIPTFGVTTGEAEVPAQSPIPNYFFFYI